MFKDRYEDFQHLARELKLLRGHNSQFKENDPQNLLLLFSEGAIVLLTLERFLRILPGVQATEKDTLHNLLEKATSQSRNILTLPVKDKTNAIQQIKNIRNTILHANFEQAAKQAKVKDVKEYFKTQFSSEIDALYRILDNLVDQINIETGHPKQHRDKAP